VAGTPRNVPDHWSVQSVRTETPSMKLKSIVFFSLIAVQSLPLLAALGEAPNASGARLTRYTGYSVSEVVSVSGTVVREYISPTNVVFGVGWQGPTMPDLKQLLGTAADRVAAGANAADGTRALNITSGDLVLHSGGHMRSFRGNAYIPSLVPVGVSTDNID
jgi:hypothetical protein